MLMLIIGMSLLYSYVMSYLHISQSTAEWIVVAASFAWVLLTTILLMVVVLGFFLPPVSIILMTAPIILPPLRAANFDLIWFGVIMTIVMEMGLIHPPVGLNIFVINNIAPDIPLRDVMWGVLPFVGLMILARRDIVSGAGYRHMVPRPDHGSRNSKMNTSFFGELLQTISERGRALAGARPARRRRRPVPKVWSSCARTCCPGAARPPAWRSRAKFSAAMPNSPPARASPSSRRWRERFGPDPARMEQAIAAWRRKPSDADRRRSARRLRAAPAGTVPPAQSRARRHRRAGAHARAVDGRARSPAEDLAAVDDDFVHLFSSWFNRGFLVLRRIDWSTPAIVLEKIIRYEAVHEIRDWDDLRRRIDPPDRRCYAFFHPALVDEPLIFVEVALDARYPRRDRADPRQRPQRVRRTRQGAHRGVLFDLELPARACRRFVRQFPDQAGGRGDLPRTAQAHDIRHAVAGDRVSPRWLAGETQGRELAGASTPAIACALTLLERPHWWTDPEIFEPACRSR